MTDVRSGPAQQSAHRLNQRGIATVWVKADSEEAALERGRNVLNDRHYGGTGSLTLFREENTHVESDATLNPRDGTAAGYIAMKLEALARRDGLFELWFPGSA